MYKNKIIILILFFLFTSFSYEKNDETFLGSGELISSYRQKNINNDQNIKKIFFKNFFFHHYVISLFLTIAIVAAIGSLINKKK